MARIQDKAMKNDFLDLQSRLEHLITYSSQLVFVSGDGMSKQLSFAQHFLSHQNELANIGYVDANAKLDVISYRKKFIQQLVGAAKVDFSKPLTVLIPRLLKTQSEFILIAVTHADRLPDEFLQELWDLVLQNRFAKNRHHLNILVFGDKEWASRAKSWLPANSNNKPVLLANEFVERTEQQAQAMSELDQLLSTKREQFHQRLALREAGDEPSPSILNQWWFKVVLAAVFFLTFSGILVSRYITMDQAKEFYASIFNYEVVAANKNASSVDQPLPDANELFDAEKSVEESPVQSNDDTPSFLKLADDQRRVVDWEDAVKSLPATPIEITSESSEGLNQSGIETTSIQPVVEDLTVDQELQTDELIPEAGELEADQFDYPVEDITSVEQLEILNGESVDVEGTDAGSLGDNVAPVVQEEPVLQTNATEAVEAVKVHEFDGDLLNDLGDNGFVLQLSAMSSQEALDFYLLTNSLENSVWIYKTQRFGGDWFVVLHNEVFDSLQSANSATEALALSSPPFAKPIRNVQQEVGRN